MQSLKLNLHSGGVLVSLAELGNVVLPPTTETFVPVPHDFFVKQVLTGLGENGLTVVSEQHALDKEGQRYFGLLQVATGKEIEGKEYSLVLGLRNSHDKKFPAALAAGAGVFVCSNLSFSGEVTAARKHTGQIMRDLPGKVTLALGRLNALWTSQETRFNAYHETVLDNSAAVNDLLVRAWRADAMPITYLPSVFNEWANPSHEEFRNRNVWSMFNAFTEVLKRTNIAELPARTRALHLLLDELAGVQLGSDVIELS